MLTAQKVHDILEKHNQELYDLAAELYQLLETGSNKIDYLKKLAEIEEKAKRMKGIVIRWSRAKGRPIRKDGQPDLRGKAYKVSKKVPCSEEILAHLDLRRSC